MDIASGDAKANEWPSRARPGPASPEAMSMHIDDISTIARRFSKRMNTKSAPPFAKTFWHTSYLEGLFGGSLSLQPICMTFGGPLEAGPWRVFLEDLRELTSKDHFVGPLEADPWRVILEDLRELTSQDHFGGPLEADPWKVILEDLWRVFLEDLLEGLFGISGACNRCWC